MTVENISWSISTKNVTDLGGVEPATSWSPVGRRIQLSHRGHIYFADSHALYVNHKLQQGDIWSWANTRTVL